MSANYSAVSDALKAGADPVMLCQTCPWDRFCITPPTMTRSEVDEKIAEAERQDQQRAAEAEAAGKTSGMPMGTLITALAIGGRDTQAHVCPVFAVRLRTSEGKLVNETLRATMQAAQ